MAGHNATPRLLKPSPTAQPTCWMPAEGVGLQAPWGADRLSAGDPLTTVESTLGSPSSATTVNV